MELTDLNRRVTNKNQKLCNRFYFDLELLVSPLLTKKICKI